jgi:hypothetical protein
MLKDSRKVYAQRTTVQLKIEVFRIKENSEKCLNTEKIKKFAPK